MICMQLHSIIINT